jgi:hypothetical protein
MGEGLLDVVAGLGLLCQLLDQIVGIQIARGPGPRPGSPEPRYCQPMPGAAIYEHLGPSQFSRLIYGAIVGLALIVGLEHEEPAPGVMAGTLIATGVAVGLAEFYSEFLGTEVATRRRVDRARFRELAANVAAVTFGASFPAIFFVLAAAGAMEIDAAFEVAKWSGLPLTAFYGFCAARLRGEGLPAALFQAALVALIGGFLIAFKALLH